MQQNASPAYQSTLAAGTHLTTAEVTQAALYLMEGFTGEQASDFITKLARHHNLPVAVFSEADIENIYDLRRRSELDETPKPDVAPISQAQLDKITSDSRWNMLADDINEPGLKIIADMVDEL